MAKGAETVTCHHVTYLADDLKQPIRVSDKGGVSAYGLGRFPVTLYYEQWVRLLDKAHELRGVP